MTHVFDSKTLHHLCQNALVPGDSTQTLAEVMGTLQSHYGDHIASTEPWVYTMLGGMVGVMKVLHCSLTEYVVLFGTPFGCQGFSGRYSVNLVDVMLYGQMEIYTRHAPTHVERLLPGHKSVLHRGCARGYRCPGEVWMLEYGRGLLIGSLPMLFTGALANALEWNAIRLTLASYGRQALRSLLRGKI